jgi:hypothetical protein
VYPKIPAISPLEAALIAAQMSAYLAALSRVTVKSTTDTSAVGTRKAIPVSFPFNEGITFGARVFYSIQEKTIDMVYEYAIATSSKKDTHLSYSFGRAR